MSNRSAHTGIVPVLVVRDIKAAVAHYRDKLGFDVGFLYGDTPTYAGVYRDEVTIHLQHESQTKRKVGDGGANILTADVDAYHAEIVGRGVQPASAPTDYPYGLREFNVFDLDGNRLSFATETKG